MPLADSWGYELGVAFLAAAQACGFSCDRAFVADGAAPEGMPPGCACQLAVVVTEGVEPWEAQGGRASCGVRRVAEVRLVLDLCTTVAGQDEVPDPAKVNARAQDQAAARWAIMRGLVTGWKVGDLRAASEPAMVGGACSLVTPSGWRVTRSGGGSARWESIWRFRTDY